MQKLSIVDWIALILVMLGGINWGLVGLFEFDMVVFVFGDMTLITRVLYTLVGMSGVYWLTMFNQVAKRRI